MRGVLLVAVRLYQRLASPFIPPSCRYFPTCSQYAYEAIAKHGWLRGSRLAVARVLRCHPGHPGGVDPVP
jgi:putative membrane protein insertion efficiency factor